MKRQNAFRYLWLLLVFAIGCEAKIQGPVFVAKDESARVTASGTPVGFFRWQLSNGKGLILSTSIDGSSVVVLGIAPGKSKLTVVYGDLATLKTVSESVDVIIYEVTQMPIIAPPAAIPVANTSDTPHVTVSTLVFVDSGDAQGVDIPISLKFSFVDPDDASTSPVIDPNGAAGGDNAPQSRGGKGPGELTWLNNSVFPFLPESDKLSALVLANITPLQPDGSHPEEVSMVFVSSTIAGDNYLFKIQAISPLGKVLRETTTTAATTVLRTFQLQKAWRILPDGADVVTATGVSTVNPAFFNDGFTDYQGRKNIGLFADGPQFLIPIPDPTAAELPTVQELTDYNSSDPARKEAARLAINAKAQAWHDRISLFGGAASQANLRQAARDLGIPLDAPAIVGVKRFSAKEDDDAAAGQTDFYPPGILIQVTAGATAKSVDPDGHWSEAPHLLEAFGPDIAPIMFVSNLATARELQLAARHTAGHASLHEPFGPNDHTDAGLLADTTLMDKPGAFSPDVPLLRHALDFSDEALLRVRGWSPLPGSSSPSNKPGPVSDHSKDGLK